MDPPDPEADLFFDALDTFPPEPFGSPSAPPPEEPAASPPAALRHRRRLSRDPLSSSHKERRSKTLKDDSSAVAPSSTLTSDQAGENSMASDARADGSQPSVDAEPPPPTFLVSIAGFVIKSLLFQLDFFITCLKIPFCLLYFPFLLATDPLGTLKQAKGAIKDWLLWVPKVLLEKASPFLHEFLGGRQDLVKLAARLAWGFFWSFYVGSVLFGLLVLAFLAGRMATRRVVEKPVQLRHDLNFDYTKAKPDALMPLSSCSGAAASVACGFDFGGKVRVKGDAGCRLLPPDHKLQLIVLLTLPESDYNRKLGMFQVRAEFLSANGKVISSSSQPCMLRFKSSHIHLLETFLKSGTLLAGYSSESQTLRLKMTGFTEGTEPTVCIRVILEQRAEYKPNAGIPEIYAASLKLESELPLLKRILWNWRRTVFIWITMGLFLLELLIILVFCRPAIIPRIGLYGGSSNRR